MTTALALIFAIQAAAVPAAPAGDPVIARMAALYEAVCLNAFPDDAAADAAMQARGATPLKPNEVAIYLHDDPGRGWTVPDGDAKFIVTIEAPPYHACGVRRELAGPPADMLAYLAATDRYKARGGAFQNGQPLDIQNGNIRSHLEAEGRPAGNQSEALMIVTDTRPDTSVEIRFVHQFSKR